jgi:glyoxylase-like metal-dependent hydrolase (beta-lactamase superfamily II)
MRKFTISLASILSVTLLSAAGQEGPARGSLESSPISAAVTALGAGSLTSVRFVGLGASFSVGQSATPAEPWPRVTLKNYTATINYDTPAMRVELVRDQGAIPPRGGGLPFVGEQRSIEFVNGDKAWNVALTPQPPPEKGGAAPAPQPPPARGPRFVEQPPQPQFDAAAERMQQVWLSPHGFLKAALANNATSRRVTGGIEVSFTVGGRYRFTGTINSQNQVERVQTSIANAVLGDMVVEAVYSDYERVGDIWFPMRIVQKQGGHPSLDLWIFSVQPNAPFDAVTPDAVRSAQPPPVRVEIQTIANGVYYLTGGSHHSALIEMKDHLVVVEAPLDEQRALAVVAKAMEAIPRKPIRFVVNTHHHFDHSGGLRTYADIGATIVTHELNRGYYDRAWSAPRTLAPDRLSQSRKTPIFQTFTDKQILTDGGRIIEVHRIANSPHHDGFAMVYLPAERLVIEADAYTPPAAAAPAAGSAAAAPTPAVPTSEPPISPTTRNLYENIRRLKLDVNQIAPLHGPRLATLDDLARASGR